MTELIFRKLKYFPDDRIYMSKQELANNTGRNITEITDDEYEKYLYWMKEYRF